jgi:NAD(P)-dependent dehydrogenase (short-subunit alcohol dehydrogenase family)
MMKLKGKAVLITGSTDGVGRRLAIRLGEAGANVLVHGRDQDRGRRVVADIKAAGGTANSWRPTLHHWLKCAVLPIPSSQPSRGSTF